MIPDDLIESIEKIIEEKKEYHGRLEHILESLKQRKILYLSDQQYLENVLNSNQVQKEKSEEIKPNPIKFKEHLKNSDLHLFLPFSILLLFGITRYIGFFGVTIYPTIDRATSIVVFQRTLTPSILFDNIAIIALGLVTMYFLVGNKKKNIILPVFITLGILFAIYSHVALDVFALLTIPAIGGLSIANQFTKKKFIVIRRWKYLAYCGIGVVFCFELFILSLWIIYPFDPNHIKQSALWYPMIIDLELFYALARLSPYVLILALYSFLVKPFYTTMLKNVVSDNGDSVIQKRIHTLSSYIRKIESNKYQTFSDRLQLMPYINDLKDTIKLDKMRLNPNFLPNVLFNPKIILGLAIVTSVLFAVYPYLPAINPHYTWVSVDDRAYQQFIKNVEEQGTIPHMIKQAFVESAGDRPLTLLIMSAFHSISGLSIVNSVRLFPVFASPALILAIYFFVKRGMNSYYGAYAALLATFSQQVIVGIYAGFLANWLGLVAVFLFFLVLHKFWEAPSVKTYLLLFGHSVLSFLMYIYIDVYLLLTLLVFLVISLVKLRKDFSARKKILILSSIFALYISIFEIRILLGSTGLFSSIFQREDIIFSFREFQNRWVNFPYFMHFYVGGFFANTVLIALAFIWALQAKYENTFDRILLAALFVGAIPIIFGNPVLQSRVFYDIPISVVAAIVVVKILNRKSVNPLLAKTTFVLLTAHLAVYALRSLSNITIGGT